MKTRVLSQLAELENLVNELTCASPKPQFVKKYMEKLGIEFTLDPVEQLNRTLRELQKLKHSVIDERPALDKAGFDVEF